MLCGPVRLGVRGLAEPGRDLVFEPFRAYSGQRVITTFFSV
jgi:hypothetical protein